MASLMMLWEYVEGRGWDWGAEGKYRSNAADCSRQVDVVLLLAKLHPCQCLLHAQHAPTPFFSVLSLQPKPLCTCPLPLIFREQKIKTKKGVRESEKDGMASNDAPLHPLLFPPLPLPYPVACGLASTQADRQIEKQHKCEIGLVWMGMSGDLPLSIRRASGRGHNSECSCASSRGRSAARPSFGGIYVLFVY